VDDAIKMRLPYPSCKIEHQNCARLKNAFELCSKLLAKNLFSLIPKQLIREAQDLSQLYKVAQFFKWQRN